MKFLSHTVILLLFTASCAAGQTISTAPRPSATPPVDDDVVKIKTTLIQVDVSVTDGRGRAITGLRPEDFEIYENGQKQQIKHLNFVSNVTVEAAGTRPAPGEVNVPVPQTPIRPDRVRRTIALVVDDLSLSFESAHFTRRALKKFVDEQMQDGDLVAIVRTGAGVGALQQFTTSKQQLHAAIERVKWNPLGRGGIGAFAPIEPTRLEEARASGDQTVTDEDLERERNTLNSFEDFRGSVFATGTLGALRYIVSGMGELTGRKSVILFSDGFRLLERNSQGNSETGRVLEFLRQLVDTANRASVVFYTIDPRGLQVAGLTAQDRVVASPEAIQSAISARRDELLETQDGLRYLARETGGFAVVNNNDLAGGVRRVLNDQSYYLIAYEPDSDTFDPEKRRFNRLEVKVNQKDANVRYRSGFFNVADENLANRPAPSLTPAQQIQNALTSPFTLNAIPLNLNPIFGSDPATGIFVRSLLHVEAKDLKFVDDPDGKKRAEISILAASFGDNGVPVNQIGKDYTITVNGDGYKKLRDEGFVYYFTFPVKDPGPYQYRVALRDKLGGTVGSASQFIEIPNLKKSGHAISGIVLQNFTHEAWERLSAVNTNSNALQAADPLRDSSLRRFRAGTVLQYSYDIYNARLNASRTVDMTTRIRVFRDGKILLEGQTTPLKTEAGTDPKRITTGGAMSLLPNMLPGDYILQIIVTDNTAKEKRRVATQVAQFEVIAP
jgi:VWFA-related protein